MNRIRMGVAPARRFGANEDVPDRRRRRIGALLAFAGVCSFAPTIPLSKLLVGHIAPLELAFARMILGACAALIFLGGRALFRRAVLPPAGALPEIAGAAMGVVIGFPLLLVFALDRLPATFGSVVSGLLPLTTAVLGVALGRERVSPWFWLPALCGSALTVYYGLERIAFNVGVLLLGAAIIMGALGYVFGARLTRRWNDTRGGYSGGPLVISWALAFSLPVALAGAWKYLPDAGIFATLPGPGLAALLYLGIVSQFLGFFVFYAGLALGGITISSQLQLLQPFLSLGLSVLLLGEGLVWLDGVAVIGIILCVWLSRRFAHTG